VNKKGDAPLSNPYYKKINNIFFYIAVMYIRMPTTIKQLKIINNATLADDGTFSIGLRDNLIIKPNAQVGLSKFLCKELTPMENVVELPSAETFTLKTDDGFPALSLSTPPRNVVVPKGIYNQQDLMATMNLECNKVLACGEINGDNTFNRYVNQSILWPTIDCGLDILFEPTNDGKLSFEFQSNKISMVFSEDGGIGENYGLQTEYIGDEPSNVAVYPLDLSSYWGYSGQNAIIKGAYQSYIQLTEAGKVGCDWYWGLRYLEDATVDNTDPIVAGVHRKADGTWELVNRNPITNTTTLTSIGYTWATGDFLVLFSASGQLHFQAYAGDPTTIDGVLDVGALKYKSITDLPNGFTSYSNVLGDSNVNFRAVISKGVSSTNGQVIDDYPFFRMLWSADRLDFPNGQSRRITMDFTSAGSLSAQMGFPTTILKSPIYEVITTFTGTLTSTVSKVQDLALYWSLPAHTYVGSQDRAKDGRENMVASFTPSRPLDTTDNLFFQEEVKYTDIGNLSLMNISTLQFRVVNLYKTFNNPLKTTYLSFVLFIKEENY
jgi:hypothetical protein